MKKTIKDQKKMIEFLKSENLSLMQENQKLKAKLKSQKGKEIPPKKLKPLKVILYDNL